MKNDDLLHIYFSPDEGSGGEVEDSEPETETEVEEEEDVESEADDALDEEEDEEFDKGRAMATIRKLRGIEKDQSKELKSLRKFKADADAKAKEEEDAEKTELQVQTERADTAEGRVTELEGTLRNERIGRAIEREASKLGFIDSQDAWSLISADGIEYDDETGSVKGHTKLLKTLAEEKPYLLELEGTPGTPPRKSGRVGGKKLKDLDEQTANEVLGVNVKL